MIYIIDTDSKKDKLVRCEINLSDLSHSVIIRMLPEKWKFESENIFDKMVTNSVRWVTYFSDGYLSESITFYNTDAPTFLAYEEETNLFKNAIREWKRDNVIDEILK